MNAFIQGMVVGGILVGAFFALGIAYAIIQAIADAEDRWSRSDHE